ncbi:MAG: thiamine pyrophosphate-dependent enzyme [Nanoarchaeota archaeon]
MNSSDTKHYSNLPLFSKEETLEMFRRMCDIRNFELYVKQINDKGLIKAPIYLSLGQESIPAAVSMIYKNPAIFAQHRCHGYYISYGGNLEELADELLHKPTGCSRGMGGSASIQSPKIRMFWHDGFMGSNAPIAVGYSEAKKYEKVLAVMGDAAAEEDYVIGGAIPWAASKKLPVLFLIEDNNLSVMTPVEKRRSWRTAKVAEAYGLNSVEISDDPWEIMYNVRELSKDLPALMNIHTKRTVSHNGSDLIKNSDLDRFSLTKQELEKLSLKKEVEEIERSSESFMSDLWKRRTEN